MKADFDATFATVRKLLEPYERAYASIVDEPGRYYLAVKELTALTEQGFAGFVKKFP